MLILDLFSYVSLRERQIVYSPLSLRVSLIASDVKFHEIFWREIFHEIFREMFLKYKKKFTMDYHTMGAGCIVHCNKVSKPVKGKYLLL